MSHKDSAITGSPIMKKKLARPSGPEQKVFFGEVMLRLQVMEFVALFTQLWVQRQIPTDILNQIFCFSFEQSIFVQLAVSLDYNRGINS